MGFFIRNDTEPAVIAGSSTRNEVKNDGCHNDFFCKGEICEDR